LTKYNFHHLSHPAHETRPDLDPMVAEIWERTANGCGHRQIHMCLVHEFGRKVSARSVLRVMRRMGLRCPIRARNPWRGYSSYRGDAGGGMPNLLKRGFTAGKPFEKLGTDVTEFKVAGGKAYLAPVYDMASKEIVAWDVSRRPDMGQRRRLLAILEARLPGGANSTRTSNSNENLTRTSSTGTPDDARYDSRDTPRRNSGTCPSQPRPVSYLTASNNRGAVQNREDILRHQPRLQEKLPQETAQEALG
jgi:hypothetical protein